MHDLIFDEAAWRLSDNQLYSDVAGEIKNNIKDEGLWLKALSEAGGEITVAEAIYINLAVQAKRDAILRKIQSHAQQIGRRRLKKILKHAPLSPIEIHSILEREAKAIIGKKLRYIPSKQKETMINDNSLDVADLESANELHRKKRNRDAIYLLVFFALSLSLCSGGG